MREHLASGDVPVERSVIPATDEGVDITVKKMMEMARGVYGARSAKIRALAINVINAAGVPDKDYFRMAEAIHNWVRDQVRYVKDPIGQETLSFPEETAFNTRAGDCLDENTRLLTPAGYVAIKDATVGLTIQGRDGWTTVTKVWDKGNLETKRIVLDNSGFFIATDEHRCFLPDGSEKTVAELVVGDALLGALPVGHPDPRPLDPPCILSMTPDGVRHVWDIETADHGIYLPDAGIVVHNCDDKTILEIAMLSSLGILAYPVVIAVNSPTFSHVYLHVVMPKGKFPNAGMTLAADPIMREWPLGREAPEGKVVRRRIYPHLLSGLGMLGSYASGPSYLDEENAADVERVLGSKTTVAGREWNDDGGSQIRDVESEGLDSMFGGANTEKVLARGPMTAAEADADTQQLSPRHKVMMVDGDFNPRGPADMANSAREPVSAEELNAISQVIDEVSANAQRMEGLGLGEDITPVLQAAGVAHLAEVKAAKAKVEAAKQAAMAANEALKAARTDYRQAWQKAAQERKAAGQKANAERAAAMANRAQATANKAMARAQALGAKSEAAQEALIQGLALFNGTDGVLVDVSDGIFSGETYLDDVRATVAGLADALPGLAGFAGPEDESLMGLGMIQSGDVLFGLGSDLLGAVPTHAGSPRPSGGIRRGKGAFSAPANVWKGARRLANMKRRKQANQAQRDTRQAVRSEQQEWRRTPAGQRTKDARLAHQADLKQIQAAHRGRMQAIWGKSVIPKPTDIPAAPSATGSAPPVQTYGPDQMGPATSAASPLPPVVDATVVPPQIPAPSAYDNAAVSEPSPTVEGWNELSPPVRYGSIAAGVAVVGLLAFLFLRRKK